MSGINLKNDSAGFTIGAEKRISDQIQTLIEMVETLVHKTTPKVPIQPTARYRLTEAAEYLGVSESTLRRRGKMKRLVIKYDGKTPFVTGSELLRYAKNGAVASSSSCHRDKKVGA